MSYRNRKETKELVGAASPEYPS